MVCERTTSTSQIFKKMYFSLYHKLSLLRKSTCEPKYSDAMDFSEYWFGLLLPALLFTCKYFQSSFVNFSSSPHAEHFLILYNGTLSMNKLSLCGPMLLYENCQLLINAWLSNRTFLFESRLRAFLSSHWPRYDLSFTYLCTFLCVSCWHARLHLITILSSCLQVDFMSILYGNNCFPEFVFS